ncbi:hypothetical protein VTI74DRAFT_8470 [Chaetomium olivicolor]
MGHSYDKAPSTTAGKTPIQWTEQVPHKYCGKLDLGRPGKPNKAHRCEACLLIKARNAKWKDGPQDLRKQRMREKMGWLWGQY